MVRFQDLHSPVFHSPFISFSDGIKDCGDESDESDAICAELCDVPSIWLSKDGCLDTLDYLGKYNRIDEGKTGLY